MSSATTQWKISQFPPGVKHKNKCWRCGCHLTFEIATVDHLRPRAKGGPDLPHNFRLCCYPCNQERGCAPLTKDERRRIYGPGRNAEAIRKDFAARTRAIQTAADAA